MQTYVTMFGGWGAILALALTAYFGWPASRAKSKARRRERLLDTRTWQTIVADLQPKWADRYFGAISASTGWFALPDLYPAP